MTAAPAVTLPRVFFGRPAPQVAPDLLGCVLAHDTADGLVAVELVEVEAYQGQADAASHAYRGRTPRNEVMFGPPGHMYVYFTYGMHFCANLVCGAAGTAAAVLMRAGRVTEGAELAFARRGTVRDLARGPARLCQALGIERAQNGADVCDPESALRIQPPDSEIKPGDVHSGPRVGVRAAADLPWRFWLAGDPAVSLYRPHVPRGRGARLSKTWSES